MLRVDQSWGLFDPQFLTQRETASQRNSLVRHKWDRGEEEGGEAVYAVRSVVLLW